MANYIKVHLSLSNNQKRKLNRALIEEDPVTLEVKKSQVNGPDVIWLTATQLHRLNGLASDKRMHVKMSKTQVSKQSPEAKELVFSMTKRNAEEVQKAMESILTNRDRIQTGGFLGAIAKFALPLIKTVLPKVLGTLGLAAATGAISGATHKATSGRGIRRSGYGIQLNKTEVEKLLQLANKCECNKLIPMGSVNKYMEDVKKQKGGFIGSLLAGLAASLLPSLLSGNGLYRTGNKK